MPWDDLCHGRLSVVSKLNFEIIIFRLQSLLMNISGLAQRDQIIFVDCVYIITLWAIPHVIT